MKKRVIYSAVLLGLCVILFIVSRLSAGFAEWYAGTVYRVIVGTVGRVFGILPFSAAEILLFLLLAVLLAGTVVSVVALIRSKRRRTTLAKAATYLLCAVSTAAFVFMTNCGVNYNRHTFLHGQDLNFVRDTETEWNVFLTLAEEFEADFPDLQSQIQSYEDGAFKLTVDLKKAVPAAMRNLAQNNKRLKVYYPPPKPVLSSELMSDAFILGVFSPFTIEANYNRSAPDVEKAMSALHESAHIAGFMREEEAEFIAFLAAKESGEPELMYAAYLYVFSQMSRLNVASERSEAFYSRLPQRVLADIYARDTFWWERYDSSTFVETISEYSAEINDTYLKIQGQADGVESYEKMIDLVIAVYR